VGSFDVKLAEQDISSDLTAREYDAIRRLARRAGQTVSMAAAANVTRFVDTTINLALVEKIERMRWQAIVNALVQLRGDNEYAEDVAYPNPAGHRVAAGGAWSNNAYDPYTDILAGQALLAAKGYTVSRMFTGTDVIAIMGTNTNIRARTGRVGVVNNALVVTTPGNASNQEINDILEMDGLPALERYDLQYRTNTGMGYFLPRGTFVMLATTGRDAEIDLGDAEPIPLPDTLGYVGVGVPAGQDDPGRVIRVEAFANKPPRIEAEGWQTSLPVITEPEAIFVITGIA
jgi:hypothetical protein